MVSRAGERPSMKSLWWYLDVGWLLDQVVVQHSDNNRAQLSVGEIVRNEQARILSGERRL